MDGIDRNYEIQDESRKSTFGGNFSYNCKLDFFFLIILLPRFSVLLPLLLFVVTLLPSLLSRRRQGQKRSMGFDCSQNGRQGWRNIGIGLGWRFDC